MLIKINVKAHPNSGKQKIARDGKSYNIYLKSSPENNKANIELIKLLKKHFNKEVRIKSGFTSRKKIIEVFE